MKNFFSRILASISSVDFYQTVIREPFSKSILMYGLFLVVLSLLLSIKFWVVNVPQIESYLERATIEATQRFPDDLELAWNGQSLSAPYSFFVDFPEQTPEQFSSQIEYLAYLSTDEGNVPNNSLFIVTPTQLQFQDEGSVVRSESLDKLIAADAFFVNKDNSQEQLKKAGFWIIEQLHTAKYFFPLGMLLYLLLTRIYLAAIESFLIFLFLKLYRVAWSYKQTLQLVLALFVPAEIINQVALQSGLELPTSILSLSFWILFVFVFFSMAKK